MLRKLWTKFFPKEEQLEDWVVEDLIGQEPDYCLGVVSGYDLPLGQEDTYSEVTVTHDRPKVDLTPPWRDFPSWMMFYDKEKPKPWRLLVHDNDSRQYVTVMSYLTEMEADQAAACVNNQWPLDHIIKPN